jgi:SPX domain protein involved in polyphosphate accumulation
MLEEKRFERKWIYNSNNILSLINSLVRSKLFFRHHFPKRKVNSIYFDDSSYTSVVQNLDGINNKTKLRLRWYGKKSKILDPKFEFKKKIGFIANKKLIKADEFNNLDFPKVSNLKKIQNIVNDKNLSKKKIYPIISTHYEREYLISSDNMIRATVDFNLESIHLKNFSQIKLNKIFSNITILEIKYPVYLDNLLRKKLDNITLRLSKNSKYVNSIFEKPSYIN